LEQAYFFPLHLYGIPHRGFEFLICFSRRGPAPTGKEKEVVVSQEALTFAIQ
jgi:hypothetical protein